MILSLNMNKTRLNLNDGENQRKERVDHDKNEIKRYEVKRKVNQESNLCLENEHLRIGSKSLCKIFDRRNQKNENFKNSVKLKKNEMLELRSRTKLRHR